MIAKLKSNSTIALFVGFLVILSVRADDGVVSGKSLKLGIGDDPDQSLESRSTTTTTEDPFFDFGFDSTDDSSSATASTTTEDPFFDFDDSFGITTLPPCSEMDELEQNPGINCDNTTVIIPEIRFLILVIKCLCPWNDFNVRYNDVVFERLFSQVWSDFQTKLNTEAQLYGQVLDPLDVDAKLPEPIDMAQQGAGYNVKVKMGGIKVIKLS